MRVLLVGDEDLALDRLRTFFGDLEGVEVVGDARDGDEALEAIGRRLDYSRERVRQIETAGLRKLRILLGARGIDASDLR